MKHLQRILGAAMLRLFRTRVVITDDARQRISRGNVVVCANHVSLLDGLLLAIASPTPMVFGVDTDFSRRNRVTAAGMAFLSWLGFGWVAPLDTSSPFGLRQLKRALNEGKTVMLFPEGRISQDGRMGAAMPGVDWLLLVTEAEVVWVSIAGAEQSRLFAKSGRKLWPRISIRIGHTRPDMNQGHPA